MSVPLLLELFERLPELKPGDDEELWAAGVQDAIRGFRAGVRERYTEGTLARLLSSTHPKTRRAAVLALGPQPAAGIATGRLFAEAPDPFAPQRGVVRIPDLPGLGLS